MQVICRTSKSIIEIAEDAFDEKLHLRFSLDAEEDPADSDEDEVLRKEMRDTIAAMRELASAVKGMTDTDARTERNQRILPGLPGGGPIARDEDFDEGTRAALSAGRTRPAVEIRYQRELTDEERTVRSFETDVMVQRYLFYTFKGMHERAQEIMRSPAFGFGGRAQNVGEDAAGGYLAPTPLANFVAMKRDPFERIAPNGITLTSPSTTLDIPIELTVGDVQDVPEIDTAGSNKPTMTNEQSTWDNIRLSKIKKGRLTIITWEMLQDQSSAFDIMTMIAAQAARKLAVAWDLEGANGGVYTNPLKTATIAQAATGTNLDRDAIVDLINALPSEWVDGGGAVLLGNAQIKTWLSKIVDTTGRALYGTQNAPPVGVGDVGPVNRIVEGYPFLEVPFDENRMYFGQHGEGWATLRDGAMRIEEDRSIEFKSDGIAIRILERRDGAVIQNDAYKKSEVFLTST